MTSLAEKGAGPFLERRTKKPKSVVLNAHELPERSYSTLKQLLTAVRQALARYCLRLNQ